MVRVRETAKTSTLTDRFSGGPTPAVPPWGNCHQSPTITSGRLHLSCTSAYEGVMTDAVYDFTDSSFLAQLVPIPTGGGNSRTTMIEIQIDAHNKVDFGYVGTGLFFRETVAGTTTNLESAAYEPSTHAWWGLRHDTIGGTGWLSAWYSPDGASWTQLGSGHATAQDYSSVRCHIYCGYYGTEASPPDAVVGNVNMPNGAGFAKALPTTAGADTATLFGAYGGYGSLGGISGTNAVETMVGRRIRVATDYVPHGAWSDFDAATMRTYQFDPWREWRDDRPGSRFVCGIPLLTDADPGDFQGVAAGTYDVYFATVGDALIAAGHADAIVMPGWEPNNSGIGPWQATDDPSGYASAFRHVVTLLRGLSGQNFTFLLESSLGLQAGRMLTAFADYYPGDSHVDYIGMNVYDMKPGDPSATAAARWNWIETQTMGLRDHVAFAASKGKPNVCAEWGCYAVNGSPDLDGGGDNPYFIRRMAAYFAANNVYYQSYFNVDWGGGTLADHPNAKAQYIATFQPRRA
jgi:hypothetical protein